MLHIRARFLLCFVLFQTTRVNPSIDGVVLRRLADNPSTTYGCMDSLVWKISTLHGGCQQGPQQENTQETMLNHHDWWENNWGRSGSSWPRRGKQECWKNRGDVCRLPEQDHVVCLPGSRRGSTISRGWALDPKSQACKPGVHCLYACEPGYYWTQFNQGETSNFDHVHAHKRGNCDGSWDYGTSTHGVYCKEDGTLQMPKEPLCKMGETFVYAENRLDKHVFLCQTVFPGHEIFLIPTLVKPGETVMITTQPMSWWHGPTFDKPPHGDIYVSFAGADIMEACTWDEFSPSGAALLPYEIGTGVEDNGAIYSTHYFYQQPNSEVPKSMVGYVMDLECESSDPNVCGDRVAHNNVITMVTRKKPPNGTKMKFVFKPAGQATGTDYVYREPNKPHMPDPMMITGLKKNAMGGPSSHPSPPSPPPPPSTSTTSFATHTQTQSAQTHQHSTSHQSTSHQSTTTPSPPAPASHYQAYGYYHGRKMLERQPVASVFIENLLDKPIVTCDGLHGPGMSVSPGEIVRLPSDGRYYVGLKGDAWIACRDKSKIAWIVDLSEDKQKYTYRLHPDRNTESPLQYGLQLKCTSNDEHGCIMDGINSLTVGGDSEETSVIFRVQPSTKERGTRQASAYQWGNGIIDFISSIFSSRAIS